jgi:hypothetical protein
MKRVTFLIFMVSAAALLLCACSSEEGTVSPKPTGSEDTVFEGVSGYCLNSGGGATNRITCEVCNPMTGVPHPYFDPGVSDTDPVHGAGYYECEGNDNQMPPLSGTIFVVVGYDINGFWGISDPFIWYTPAVNNVTVNEN